jgi:prepilin-type processing-associated H-X9-DG protein
LDEHPDSINDGYFLINPGASQWGDLPASYHNGAAGFSFADGHSEIHRWLYPSTKRAVTTRGDYNGQLFPSRERGDNNWVVQRTSILR